jgi:hypothetical protein
MVCTTRQIYSGAQIKKNKMGGACGMYVREEFCIESFGMKTWVKETTSKT